MATAADEPLDYRTAATQIERALVDRLSLAYQERRPPVADLAALRAVPTKYVAHRDLVFVEGVGVCYRWLDTANDPDDNDGVIAALDLDHGRWVKCAVWLWLIFLYRRCKEVRNERSGFTSPRYPAN